VTYSLGTFRGGDCGEGVRPVLLAAWNLSGTTRVTMAVASGASDACLGGAPAHTPRFTATLAPLPPGRVDVRLLATHSCYCPPASGWTEERAQAEAP
jgi:hypothetical protein